MISISNALKIIAGEVRSLGTETVGLTEAVGRVLSRDIIADTDLPPFDRSQMDGYAVQAADTKGAPILLKVVGESAAGAGWRKTLKSGEAVSIMTGAPLPKGADGVQKIELTLDVSGSPQFGSDSVTVLEPVKKGQYIVPRGYEVKKGTKVLPKGTRVTPEMVAVLAAFGCEDVQVSQRPKLAALSTGSEIVDVREKPARDQIRNSNSPMLLALAEKYGATAETLPIAGDDVGQLSARIGEAAETADVVAITGGVSVGKYDLTKTSLHELGAEILFERIRLKPGKPTVFAKLGDKLVFGLPGNPVSVAVTFHLFVRTALLMMQGAESDPENGFAVLAKPVKGTKERDSYLPATLKTDKKGRLIATPLKWHGSSDFISFARAQAVIVVPRGKNLDVGEAAKILYL
jgi:molybdopterin molybdotransferase